MDQTTSEILTKFEQFEASANFIGTTRDRQFGSEDRNRERSYQQRNTYQDVQDTNTSRNHTQRNNSSDRDYRTSHSGYVRNDNFTNSRFSDNSYQNDRFSDDHNRRSQDRDRGYFENSYSSQYSRRSYGSDSQQQQVRNNIGYQDQGFRGDSYQNGNYRSHGQGYSRRNEGAFQNRGFHERNFGDNQQNGGNRFKDSGYGDRNRGNSSNRGNNFNPTRRNDQFDRRRFDRNGQDNHYLSGQSQTVQSFYNQKRDFGNIQRKKLETFHIRVFHNWVKSVLIQKYGKSSRQQIREESKSESSIPDNFLYVLDAACGKGGDHKKWMLHSKTAFYLGVDIAFESLQEAHKRAVKTLEEIKQFSRVHSNIKFGFYEKDMTQGSEEFWKYIIAEKPEVEPEGNQPGSVQHYRQNSDYKFDIVSCQMAMHYMLQNEGGARNFLDNCSMKLNELGYLLLTFTDQKILRNLLLTKGIKSENQVAYTGKYFSIRYQLPTELNSTENNDLTYGEKYDFYLQEAVGNQVDNQIQYVPEYFVNVESFIDLAKNYNLEVIENSNFIEFYQTNKIDFSDLLKSMKVCYSEAAEVSDPLDWEISHCYRVLVLQKKTPNFSRYVFDRTTRDKFLYKYPVPFNFNSKRFPRKIDPAVNQQPQEPNSQAE